MVEDTPNSDNHQELKGYFKTKREKLFFGLKIAPKLLYILLTILPLSLTLAASLGLTSEKFSIILTILIYCLLTCQISQKLMKPLFGDFGGLWLVRIIVFALACVYSYFAWLMITSSYASDYGTYQFVVVPLFIAFLMLSCIPLGKMILDKSDIVQWRGPLPTFCTFALPADEGKKTKEELIREYKGESDDPWVARKITRCVPAYASGLVFSVICFLLGFLLLAFILFNILLVMIISVWLMNDLYYLMRKKSLFKVEELYNVFVGRNDPEKGIISSLLPSKRHSLIKQLNGIVCILTGITTAAFISFVFFTTVLPFIFKYLVIRTKYNDITEFMGLFTGLAYVVIVVLATIFQLNFWYILVKRFPHFLVVWAEKNFSTDVEAPKLPTGGFSIFLVNAAIIIFLFTFFVLLDWISYYLNVPADTTWGLISFIAIVTLLLCFEIYITSSTIKNRGLRETDPNNLYKDNRRIPFAVVIQSYSVALPIAICASQGSDATSEALHTILLTSIVSCLLIQLFYMEDMRLYLRKQDSENHVKRKIKESIPFFILAFMAFIFSYSLDYCWGTKIVYLGIITIIIVAIGFIILMLYDKPKTAAIKKPPEK